MAFCRNCGEKLITGAKFCSGCGIAITGGNYNDSGQRKIFYDGEIHKCPQCGDMLNSFSPICASCGYELRGVKMADSVKDFADKLQEIEEKREKENWGDVLKQKLLNKKKLSWVDQQKISLIKNFPIPNTKEDILEFMTMAQANKRAYKNGTGNELLQVYDAWNMKVEQVFQKIILNFSDDVDFLNRVVFLMEKKDQKRLKKAIKTQKRKKIF